MQTQRELRQQRKTDWQKTISEGDVVSFNFPICDGKKKTPPAARPCLIVDIFLKADMQFVMLAYGIRASDEHQQDALDIAVTEPEKMLAAGLIEPTLFIARHRIFVSMNNAGFQCNELGTPVIGQLSHSDLTCLKATSMKARKTESTLSSHWSKPSE